MIFIVEGSDKTGKTTLANKLAEKHSMKVIHLDAPRSQEEFDNMFNMYVQLYTDTNDVVFDRSFYSDLVYGPIYRGGPAITQEQRVTLENLLISKGVVVIHCTDTVEAVWERCVDEGDEFSTSKELVEKIIVGYNAVFNTTATAIPVVRYTIGATTNVEL